MVGIRFSWMRSWLAAVFVVAVGVGVFLGGVVWVHRATKDQLQDCERYQVRFLDIQCTPPPKMNRHQFLTEVQYLAELPDILHVLDDDLARKLEKAFCRHPWVEEAKVIVDATPSIRASLVFRRPVLAVKVNGTMRAVDRHGILLPPTAETKGLPVYDGDAPPPAGSSGQPWGNELVERAARKFQ
ncbi:MAG: hypothetical protein KatS3mg105_4574 [Gemmatales bacterium]|nr:MAG: hypothetical protein KatS3mg105_4574 [Gemmatales bacterium]